MRFLQESRTIGLNFSPPEMQFYTREENQPKEYRKYKASKMKVSVQVSNEKNNNKPKANKSIPRV